MDEIVLRGMARWPDVPAVFGWLALDRRGRWRLRGEPIGNRTASDYIGRNYLADEHGRWYFQNGPQRVFVSLEHSPLVFGLEPDGSLRAHTGALTRGPRRVLLDDAGDLLLDTDLGPGLLEAADLLPASERFCDAQCRPLPDDAVEAALADASRPLWLQLDGPPLAVQRIVADNTPSLLGFVREPQPRAEDGRTVGP